ncbi:MAG: hypothetical protein L0177_02840 [Chloroflexi bacterium]|nr:hypothetical protein [Chloroflexota bacterium]
MSSHLKLLSLTALFAFVLVACQETVQPVPPPPIPMGDWQFVEAPAGPDPPGFSLRLPPEWTLRELQGIDSYVGEIMGGGVRLGFDYGGYSNRLPYENDPRYVVTYQSIGGIPAKLVRPREEAEDLITGVHFADIDGVLLTVSGRGLTREQQDIAFAIFRTIRRLPSDQGVSLTERYADVTGEWETHTAVLRLSDGRVGISPFTVKLPPEWELSGRMGADSWGGELVGPEFSLIFQGGPFATIALYGITGGGPMEFDSELAAKHSVSEENVNGMLATIVLPLEEGQFTGAIVQMPNDRVVVSVRGLSPEQQDVAFAIISTMRPH